MNQPETPFVKYTREMARLDRALAIMEHTMQSTKIIIDEVKRMPRVGKSGRNIFLKTYNRRPRNKVKTGLCLVNLAMLIGSYHSHNLLIRSQPLPPFAKGSAIHLPMISNAPLEWKSFNPSIPGFDPHPSPSSDLDGPSKNQT